MTCSCAPIFKFFYTLPDGASTEYQISNREFSDFLHTYIVMYSWRSVFSCDNGQCDAHPAGIAVTRSSHCICFQLLLFLVSFLYITLLRLPLRVTQSHYFNKRLRWYFQADLGDEKPFPANGTDLEIAARWHYDTCHNVRENCQNLRKWVQSLCAPLRPFRSEMKEKFYHSLLPHVLQMCTRIQIFRYLVTGCHNKIVNLQRQCQKCTVGRTFLHTESLLSLEI